MASFAKANIPKLVLAEANFLLKTLSDDDQSFMRKVLLKAVNSDSMLHLVILWDDPCWSYNFNS